MKKLIITTVAVFAVTLTFAQEQGREGVHINKQTGEKERVVFVRPQKQVAAAQIADVHLDHPKKEHKTNVRKKAKPVVHKHKAKLQHKDKMAPKGNFKTK